MCVCIGSASPSYRAIARKRLQSSKKLLRVLGYPTPKARLDYHCLHTMTWQGFHSNTSYDSNGIERHNNLHVAALQSHIQIDLARWGNTLIRAFLGKYIDTCIFGATQHLFLLILLAEAPCYM